MSNRLLAAGDVRNASCSSIALFLSCNCATADADKDSCAGRFFFFGVLNRAGTGPAPPAARGKEILLIRSKPPNFLNRKTRYTGRYFSNSCRNIGIEWTYFLLKAQRDFEIRCLPRPRFHHA